MNNVELNRWYDESLGKNKLFCSKMQKLMEEIISNSGIYVHSITGRVKEKDSLIKKYQSKNYKSIEEMTDVIGIRVITYILEDVDLVCNLVKAEFDIDENNSVDKSSELKENETGYLSVHYISKLSPPRHELSEYIIFKGVMFEIQIRTLLQHAWAEIEHDNSYKFAGILPSEIKRRFYLTAGTLELMDREFQRLSDELHSYKIQVSSDTKEGHLDIEINSASLIEYLSEKFKNCNNIKQTFNNGDAEIVQELSDFGITTIKDLDAIVKTDFIGAYKSLPDTNYIGLLRHIMIAEDAHKYFRFCWKRHWRGINISTSDFLSRYIDINEIIEIYDLIIDFDD